MPTQATDIVSVQRELVQLEAALTLVECMAGAQPGTLSILTDVRSLYPSATAVARRRFDALAAETAGVAASGIEALLGHKARVGTEPRFAATRLCEDIRDGLAAMRRILA